MSSTPVKPPPLELVLSHPWLVPLIREAIQVPPDPEVLHWTPPPDFDAEAVSVRLRLEKAAKEKKQQEQVKAREEAATRVRSAFGPATTAPDAPLAGKVDFSTAGALFGKPDTEAPAAPRPAFGAPSGGRGSGRKAEEDTEGRRKPRTADADIMSRLKKEWLGGDKG